MGNGLADRSIVDEGGEIMKLYHGSYAEVKSPEVNLGRKRVDFGQGFYLTNIVEQAEKWATIVAFKKNLDTAIVNVYDWNEERVKSGGWRVKVFEEYDIEWLEYVIDCRKGGVMQDMWDIVEGGVANDNVIDTVENYENGVITAEQALGQLKYKKVNHQLCLRNQEVLDSVLRFVDSYQVNI